ncbi:unnamed protein product [Toxocara canis]|uniref:Transmembrane protein n=1 Tax=Toxocara canis TaxID=6265 RepID=A0A183UID5_TOXCA|nr:unnamed protein product [Toxocara canis]
MAQVNSKCYNLTPTTALRCTYTAIADLDFVQHCSRNDTTTRTLLKVMIVGAMISLALSILSGDGERLGADLVMASEDMDSALLEGLGDVVGVDGAGDGEGTIQSAFYSS